MTENTDANLIVEDDENEGPGLEVAAEPAPKAKKAAKPAAPAAPKRVRIILEENDNIPPTGQFFGVNGRSYLLRAGEEAVVPVEVIEVLNDAVEETPRIDGNGNVVDFRKKMRFPYRLLGPAD